MKYFYMILTLFMFIYTTNLESKNADLQVKKQIRAAIIIYPKPRGTGAFQMKGMMENEAKKQSVNEKSSEFQLKKLRRIKIVEFISEYPTMIFLLISLVFIVIFVLILPCLLYLYFESTRIE